MSNKELIEQAIEKINLSKYPIGGYNGVRTNEMSFNEGIDRAIEILRSLSPKEEPQSEGINLSELSIADLIALDKYGDRQSILSSEDIKKFKFEHLALRAIDNQLDVQKQINSRISKINFNK